MASDEESEGGDKEADAAEIWPTNVIAFNSRPPIIKEYWRKPDICFESHAERI